MTTLTRARPPYLIPSYSLTGDLLAYQKCGLQYRYQNRGALPPSVPVQLWFGEFIHALMEESFRRWEADPSFKSFPWDWSRQVRPIELEIYKRLASQTMPAPPNLFCPCEGGEGCVRCGDPEHKLIASRRADALLRTWAPHLFPLIAEPEVRLRTIRPMPTGGLRSDYYEVTGIVDVLGSVEMAQAPPGNLLLHELQNDEGVAPILEKVAGGSYEVIVDYKGIRRPAATSPDWDRLAWQVLTYAWLRAKQPGASPVVAGVLIFVNELEPSGEDLKELKLEAASAETDVMPTGADVEALAAWRPRQTPPEISTGLREKRSYRVIPIDPNAIEHSLSEFDGVVDDIEQAVAKEISGQSVVDAWRSRPSGLPYSAPDQRTCTACDHRYHCPLAASDGIGGTPVAP